MNNNFFDNYTKKTTGETPAKPQGAERPKPKPQPKSQATPKPQPKQQPKPQPKQKPADAYEQRGAGNFGQDDGGQGVRLGVPVQDEHVGSNMPVQRAQNGRSVQSSTQNDGMKFEQRSTFKPPEPR